MSKKSKITINLGAFSMMARFTKTNGWQCVGLIVPFFMCMCTTGKVFTGSGKSNGFSYALPETVVKVNVPVTVTFEAGAITAARLDVDSKVATAALMSVTIAGYPAQLDLRVMDQSNNSTSLDKFEVKYYPIGSDSSAQSTGILQSINSDMTDNTAAIIGNLVDSTMELGKLALNTQGAFLQSANSAVQEDSRNFSDSISISKPLHEDINSALASEINRIKKRAKTANAGQELQWKGITKISLKTSAKAWPSLGKGGEAEALKMLAERIAVDTELRLQDINVNKKGLEMINGVVYPDASNAKFDLYMTKVIGFRNGEPKTIEEIAGSMNPQIPEGGKLKLMDVNPKVFGKRTIGATFAMNGKLLSWNYASTSRALAASGMLKAVSASVDTSGSAMLSTYTKNRTAAATAQKNANTLKTNIITKQGELDVARKTVITKQHALDAATKAFEKTNTPALQSAVDIAESELATAEAAVKTKQSELNGLKSEMSNVAAGLLTP